MSDSAVKVSVIMPVYKVEKFVGKAIESMLAQTLTDFEFLIVDDGTPDNSGVICDEYAARDSRIRVFHRENGGAPSARNMAMDKAQGKYYYFMDSDDWAEPTMLEDMVTLAEENQAQLVVAGYYIDTYYNDTEYLTLNQVQPTRCTIRRLSAAAPISCLTPICFIPHGISCSAGPTWTRGGCASLRRSGTISPLCSA